MKPLVTVLLPVYNASTFLRIAIDSILSQTYKNIEVIIIDDGSTDNSIEIIQSYEDPRIIYIPNGKNMGIVKTLNKGIFAANGKYIARMDADDICFATRIEKQVNYLETHPNVVLVASKAELIDQNGNSLKKYDSPDIGAKKLVDTLPYDNYICHPSIMMKKEVMSHYMYRNIVYEDYDLWLRLANDKLDIEKINEPLLFYRIHEKSIMGTAKSNGNNFIKSAGTRKFYLKNLSFKDKVTTFNVKVFLYMLYTYLFGYYKFMKNKFIVV